MIRSIHVRRKLAQNAHNVRMFGLVVLFDVLQVPPCSHLCLRVVQQLEEHRVSRHDLGSLQPKNPTPNAKPFAMFLVAMTQWGPNTIQSLRLRTILGVHRVGTTMQISTQPVELPSDRTAHPGVQSALTTQ